MDNSNKEVAYALYCKTCENEKKENYTEPCEECLECPVREGTSVPLCYKRKE